MSNRFVLFVSSCCVFALLVPSFGMIRYFILHLMFVGVVLWRSPRVSNPLSLTKWDRMDLMFVILLLIFVFYLHWHDFFLHLCGGSSSTANLLTFVAGAVLSIGGSVFIASLLDSMMGKAGSYMVHKQEYRFVSKHSFYHRDVLISLLLAFLVITVCSCFSPLYATNTWCSPACYHTVGKSFWNGLLPYRDLYEHKGPLVYALYSVATLISYKSFFGMYVLSLPFAFCFFHYSLKTLRVLTNRPIASWFIVVGTGVYCTTSYFCGGSVEELLLPFLAFALYVIVKYVKSVDNPCEDAPSTPGLKRTVSFLPRRLFLGMGMAVVLWSKFNILAFYIAIILFFLVYTIRIHRFHDFLKAVLPVTIGFLSVTFPLCLFYSLNGAFDDMMRVYFHDNLFLYMEPSDVLKAGGSTAHPITLFFTVMGMHIRDNSMFFISALIAWIWLRRKHIHVSWLFLSAFVLTALSVFIKPDYYKYYSFILAVFVPFCVLPLSSYKLKPLFKKQGALVLTLVTVAVVVAGSENLWKMRLKKDDYIQFRFARTIMKEKHPTLLNYYCQDQGVFAVTGIVPTDRYYCDFNNELPAVHEAHDSIVANQQVQFVVTMWKSDLEGYSIVDQAMCPVKGVMFYLYKRD